MALRRRGLREAGSGNRLLRPAAGKSPVTAARLAPGSAITSRWNSRFWADGGSSV
jgi:hypothetical protein